MILAPPRAGQIRHPERSASWVADMGGDPVWLLRVRNDAATLRLCLADRGRTQDAGKRAGSDAFLARMQPAHGDRPRITRTAGPATCSV